MDTKEKKAQGILSVIFFFAGIVSCATLFGSGALNRTLATMSINHDISPTVSVLILTLFCLLLSLVLYIISRNKANVLFIPVTLFFVTFGIANSVGWLIVGCEIDTRPLPKQLEKEYAVKTSEKEGYVYIGDIRGYYEKNDHTYWKTFILYVKLIDGKKYYYCSIENDYYIDTEKYLVQRYGDGDYGEIRDDDYSYVIEYDFDWEHIYVKTLTPNTSETNLADSKTTKTNYIDNEKPQKIVVEHQRQPQPVQEWVPCMTCQGSRNCTVCGGSGWLYNSHSATNRQDCYNCNGRRNCPACGGQGGSYITVYR